MDKKELITMQAVNYKRQLIWKYELRVYVSLYNCYKNVIKSLKVSRYKIVLRSHIFVTCFYRFYCIFGLNFR
jgi:hypothetical protein